jgi:RNA polymerase sigma factor (sigma-70 family)
MSLRTLLSSLVQRWRGQAAPGEPGALSDAELLARFAADRDPAAFEVLVWRHGAMVLGVCRRLLRRLCDVEDAFQAAFLTLVRKADSVRRGAALAGWLYQVAQRVALRLRAGLARQGRMQPLAQDPPDRTAGEAPAEEGLRAALDEEIGRLPEKYRLVVVFCYLEGRTTAEAARALGCPRGTVLGRLAWARRRLAARLRRLGLAPAAALAALAAGRAAPAAALVTAAVQAATRLAAGGAVAPPVAALVKGVVWAMFLNKLKWAAAVLVVALLGTAAGWWAYSRAGAEPPGPGPARADVESKKGDKAEAPKAADDKPRPKPDPDKEERDKRRAEFADALRALEKAEEDLDLFEAKQTELRIEAKGELARLRERRRQLEAVQAALMKEFQKVQAAIAEAEAKLSGGDMEKALKPLREQELKLEKRLVDASDSAEKLQTALIRAEETLQLTERQGERKRARYLAEVEGAEARLRRLKGEEAPAAPKGLDLSALERKIEQVQRELEEVRRELRRLRE